MKPGTGPPAPGDDGLNTRFRFDRIVVDAAAHTLLRDGEPQPLEPKAFAVLLALLRRPGELLGRDELLDQVWGHRHVTPGVLTRAIAQHYFDTPGSQYTPSKLAVDFAGQVVTNARITVRKLALFKYSLLLFGFGVLIASAAMAFSAFVV